MHQNTTLLLSVGPRPSDWDDDVDLGHGRGVDLCQQVIQQFDLSIRRCVHDHLAVRRQGVALKPQKDIRTGDLWMTARVDIPRMFKFVIDHETGCVISIYGGGYLHVYTSILFTSKPSSIDAELSNGEWVLASRIAR